MSLRICHVNYSGRSGGATNAALRLAEGQLAAGMEVTFCALSRPLVKMPFLIPPPPLRKRHRLFRRIQKLILLDPRGDRSIAVFKTGIGDWLQTHPFDILHFHWLGNQFIGWPDIARIRKPIVWTFHDTWPLINSRHYPGNPPRMESDLWEAFFKRGRDAALHLQRGRWGAIGPSSWMSEMARESGLFKAENVRNIPNPYNPGKDVDSDRQDVRARLSISGKVVLFLAGSSDLSDPRKGMDNLVRAWRHLGPVEDQLVLFGKNPPKRFAGDTIRHVGCLDSRQMKELFHAADWFISPSLEENFSNLIIEAMVSGLPVIGTPAGGTGDLVVDGLTGILSHSCESGGLLKAIRKALETDSPSALGRVARERTSSLVETGKVVSEHVRLYHHLLDSKNHG